MAQRRFGIECARCRSKFRKGEELYFAWPNNGTPRNLRVGGILLCGQCAETHVGAYIFLSYMVFVGGVSSR